MLHYAFNHLKNVICVDFKWNKPGAVDLLLGVSLSLSIIIGQKVFLIPGLRFGINSHYVWL